MDDNDAATGPSGLLVSTVQSFNTNSTDYQDVPGGSLTLPGQSVGQQWLLLVSATLRASPGNSSYAAYAQLTLSNAVVATAGYDNGELGSPLPWLTFVLIEGQDLPQVVSARFRTSAGPSATIEDLILLGVPLADPDRVHYLEDNPVLPIAQPWGPVAALDFDVSDPSRYLLLGTVTMREATASNSIGVRFVGPDMTLWPNQAVGESSWLYNHRGEWASALIARVVTLEAGTQSFILELNADGGEARDIRLIAIDTALFESVDSKEDLPSVELSTEPADLSILEVPARPDRDRVVLQMLTMRGVDNDSNFTRGRRSSFLRNGTVQGTYVRYNDTRGPLVTDGVISLVQDPDQAAVWRNQVSGDGGTIPIEAKESVIHVLTLAPQQN